MKRIISLGITVAILVAMALTCPKEKDHFEAISSKFADYAGIAKPLVKLVSDKGVKGVVKVTDCVLFSIGQNRLDDNKLMSVGVFGHVFVF